jgi:hypothetical protein
MKTLPLIALVFCVSFTSLAQSPETTQAQLDTLRSQGYEALYNLDYETARRSFREMMRIAPDHPAGAQCFAASLWLQQLNESWELQATLYNEKSYARDNQKLDGARVKDFQYWIRTAKTLSLARLRRDPSDQEALYLLGAAEGLEAAFAAAIERKFMRALRSGSDSVEHHRALLKLTPGMRDAELTIGLYNYILGALPLPLKMLARSFGVSGSKKRGLETLERVSREGHWARDVARVLLVDLYKREKRWDDAIQVSRELADHYSRNYLFKLQLADALTAKIPASRQVNVDQLEISRLFNSLLSDKRLEPSTVDLVHFRYGETLLQLGDSGRALGEFQRVANDNSADIGLRALSRLRVAQCLDLEGKRNEALATYRLILADPTSNEVQEAARKGLREMYQLQPKND